MFQFEPGKAPITLTEAAVARAKLLMEKVGDEKVLGLRVGVKTTGCSGLSYFVEYATEQKKFEDKVEENGITLFIDPTAVMFIIVQKWTIKKIRCPLVLYSITRMKSADVDVERVFQSNNKPSSTSKKSYYYLN